MIIIIVIDYHQPIFYYKESLKAFKINICSVRHCQTAFKGLTFGWEINQSVEMMWREEDVFNLLLGFFDMIY